MFRFGIAATDEQSSGDKRGKYSVHGENATRSRRQTAGARVGASLSAQFVRRLDRSAHFCGRGLIDLIADVVKMKPQKQERNRRGQFPKGVSGNPSGRPRGRASITAALRELAAQVAPDEMGDDSPEGQTWAERIALRLLEGASRGDASLARLVLDRIDGRALDVEPSACEPMEFAPIVLRSGVRDVLQ